MADAPLHTQYKDDHDTLIELCVVFREFKEEYRSGQRNIEQKINDLLKKIDTKADIRDLDAVVSRVDMHDAQVRVLQEQVSVIKTEHRDAEVRKHTYITLGNIGAKGWAMIVGAVGLLITLWKL